MVGRQCFRIAGSGSYLPTKRVSAEELDQRCGLPTGWSRQHIGVENRYECLAPESMISMGCHSINQALADAKLSWGDIDMIVDCSTSQYRPIPCNAAHYQAGIGGEAAGIPCFDIHSTCLGSLVAMNTLNGLFASPTIRNVVLVAAESGLGGVNYSEPESACLIGDGSAALILSARSDPAILAYSHETFAEHIELCRIEGGGHKRSVFQFDSAIQSQYRFSMDGPALFRVAIQKLKPLVQQLIDAWEIATEKGRDQIHFVPHQASPRALKSVQRMFGVNESHYHVAVKEVGNMIAASLPFMFDRVRKSGAVSVGDSILAMGTSAGYSQAALILEL